MLMDKQAPHFLFCEPLLTFWPSRTQPEAVLATLISKAKSLSGARSERAVEGEVEPHEEKAPRWEGLGAFPKGTSTHARANVVSKTISSRRRHSLLIREA